MEIHTKVQHKVLLTQNWRYGCFLQCSSLWGNGGNDGTQWFCFTPHLLLSWHIYTINGNKLCSFFFVIFFFFQGL